MEFIDDLEALGALYGTPGQASLAKVARHLTPAYRAWIARSRLCILSTVGPEGTDASPRGDDGPVVRELDPGTLALPDWRGNDRIDSLTAQLDPPSGKPSRANRYQPFDSPRCWIARRMPKPDSPAF